MYRFIGAATVTLYIGPKKADVIIHKDVICSASKFFDIAFNSTFKEGSEQTMELPEEQRSLFDVFVAWLYSGSYLIPQKDASESYISLREPLQLYFLADRYQVTKLKRIIVDQLFAIAVARQLGSRKKLYHIRRIYDQTSLRSGLRILVIDDCAWHADNLYFRREKVQDWLRSNAEIATDFALSFNQRTIDPWTPNPIATGKASDYYDEEETQEATPDGK